MFDGENGVDASFLCPFYLRAESQTELIVSEKNGAISINSI